MFQIATALILFLAANTQLQRVPAPRRDPGRGRLLARASSASAATASPTSWGIVLLAGDRGGAATSLFGGNTTSLIPLYSVGVFVCFTLSQSGMVRHWVRTRAAGLVVARARQRLRRRADVGRPLIVVTEKFSGGAFVVVILIPLLVGMMLFIHRQYARSARQLAIQPDLVVRAAEPRGAGDRPDPRASTAPRSRPSTSPARSPSRRSAVYITRRPGGGGTLRERWERQVPGVPLVVVESPYRALAGPLIAYLDVLDRAWPPDKPAPITFVVLPSTSRAAGGSGSCTTSPPGGSAARSSGRPHTVVVGVPYRREDAERPAPAKGPPRHRGR